MKIPQLLIVSLCLTLSGCANLVGGLTAQMADDLATSILNSDDIDTVREGVPAYLLLIDSFLVSSPDNADLLIAASSLNGAYSVFTDGERAMRLTSKSLNYAQRAACGHDERLCELQTMPFAEFEATVAAMTEADLAVAYPMAVAWTGWMQAHSADFTAIAQLSRVKSMMARIIELDETWEDGGPHLYMGGLETVLPAAMGGKPEKGKDHFERALAIAEGKFLMTHVIYAEQYARLVFDKELHDRLLRDVLASDPVVEGMTLTNRIAQERAKELLADSDDYF